MEKNHLKNLRSLIQNKKNNPFLFQTEVGPGRVYESS